MEKTLLYDKFSASSIIVASTICTFACGRAIFVAFQQAPVSRGPGPLKAGWWAVITLP